jgi:glucarate dehydratase
MMEDDILTERLPISDKPNWGRIDKPGLGVDVDEDKVARYHEAYRKLGDFPTYAGKVASSA